MNRVSICNLALGRIGTGTQHRLADFNEDTEVGRACQELFDFCNEWVAGAGAWRWLTEQRQANLLPTTAAGAWAYAYAYPVGVATVWAFGAQTETFDRAPLLPGIVNDHARMSGYFASDVADAWMWVTKIPSATGDFTDNGYVDALAWKLAVELALVLKADRATVQYAQTGMERALPEALVKSAWQLRQAQGAPLPASLQARRF